ncbi:MAG: hypothetical protein U0V70_02700 [Terriglobia bacterium]
MLFPKARVLNSCTLWILFLFLVLPSSPKAQQPPAEAQEPPDLKIVDSGVTAIAKDTNKFGSQPSLEHPVPEPGPGEEWDKYGANRRGQGVDYYEIHITVKNLGTNTVKSIDWQYTFLDAEGEKELKRFRIRSKKKIPPKGMAILTKAFMPTLVFDEDPKPEFARGKQKANILRVVYDDDSTWEPAPVKKTKP